MNQTSTNQTQDKYYSTQTIDTSVDSIMLKNSVVISAVGAILFCALNVYYIISDIARNFWATQYGIYNAVALWLLVLTSVAVIVVRYNKKLFASYKILRITMLIFYTAVVVVVSLFTFTAHIRAFESGAQREFVGIMLSAYYLMLFMLAPLPSKYDSLYLVLLVSVSGIVLWFMPGREMFDPIKQFSFRAVVIAGYYYMRRINSISIKNQIDVQSLNQKLTISSYVDSLTHALNRYALDDYLHTLTQCVPPPSLSVIMMDLDDFKMYNDTYSHNKGDEVLTKVCDCVRQMLGEKDKYLFRYGGEEFVVLLTDCTDEQLVAVAQGYKTAINALSIPRGDGGVEKYVSLSFGCAQLGVLEPRDGIDYIAKADAQLYNAKDSGKNCISFNDEIFR